jgi:hypothetical protein
MRLHALLRAARNTRYYRPLLDAAAIENHGALLEALRGLPPLEYNLYRSHPAAFVNPRDAKPPRARLFSPLPPVERIAALAPGFQRGSGVRVFDETRRSRLIRFRPAVLAGPVGILRHLAEAREDRGAPVPRVTHAVIAFSGLQYGFLSEEARALFWRVFEVPVFGQYLGLDGELLAWECEAHEGWHVREEDAIFEVDTSRGDPELLVTSLAGLRRPLLRVATGLSATLERSTCACGRPALNLVGLRRCAPRPSALRQPELALAARGAG